MRPLGRQLLLAVSFCVVAPGLRGDAVADPIAVRSGKVVLPITGLSIELPRDARKKATWKLSGSWSLSNGGASFDGRDVVDLDVGGKLVAGTWVHVGYFDAGDCSEVVKELDVADRWLGEVDLFGEHFQASGGTWDFENELGKVPAVALCTDAPDRPALLLYRFFLERKPPAGQAGLAALKRDKLLDQVTRAWRANRTGPAWPTHRPEIRQRGEIAPARTVTLGNSALEVALPDDGFVWLARKGEDGGSDFLDRMSPSMPDVTLEVASIRTGDGCARVVESVTSAAEVHDEPLPTGVPPGWTAYSTIRVAPRLERLICRDVTGGALVVGLLADPPLDPASRDFGPLGAILAALAAAVK